MISAAQEAGTSRPGFERLLVAICEGRVGIVLSLEASRLARNGRDWHTLLEFCALVGCLLGDEDGLYDPRLPNDRLLLGMKGTLSEMELSTLRQRSLEALRLKASRGELFLGVAVGYVKVRRDRIAKDPDRRVREAVDLVFRKFAEFRSIRQVHLWLRQEEVLLPAVRIVGDERRIVWKPPVYGTVHKLLTNPVYAGAYAFGRTESRVTVENGRKRVTRGFRRDRAEWGRVDPRSPRRLRFLGRVREEPAADRRQRQLPGPDGKGRRAPRRCAARGPAALRTLWPARACPLQRHQGILRPVWLPRRACQPRHQALHRLRRLARGYRRRRRSAAAAVSARRRGGTGRHRDA